MSRFFGCFTFAKKKDRKIDTSPTFYTNEIANHTDSMSVSSCQQVAVIPIVCPSAPAIIKKAAVVRPIPQQNGVRTKWTHHDYRSLTPEKGQQTRPNNPSIIPDRLKTRSVGHSLNPQNSSAMTQLYYPYPEGNTLFPGLVDEGCRMDRVLKMADAVVRRKTENRVVVLTDEERAARGIH